MTLVVRLAGRAKRPRHGGVIIQNHPTEEISALEPIMNKQHAILRPVKVGKLFIWFVFSNLNTCIMEYVAFLFVLGHVPLHEGGCGHRDTYVQNTLTLEQCMQKCIENLQCTAITFKEGHGNCGIHQGAIQIINGYPWTLGSSCYARQGKIFGNLFAILFTI